MIHADRNAHEPVTPLRLRRTVTCPNCNEPFASTQVRFVAEHPSLAGDPVAGPQEQLRFRPSRFDSAGNAIDPAGQRCARTACPSCHCQVPRRSLVDKSLAVTVVATGSGNPTPVVAAALEDLVRSAEMLGIEASEVDPELNEWLRARPADIRQPVRVAGVDKVFPRPAFRSIRANGGARRILVTHSLSAADLAVERLPSLATCGALVVLIDERESQRVLGDTPPASVDALVETIRVLDRRVRTVRSSEPSAPARLPSVIAFALPSGWTQHSLGTGWPKLDTAGAELPQRAIATAVAEVHRRLRDTLQSNAPSMLRALAAGFDQVRLVAVPPNSAGPDAGGWTAMPLLLAAAAIDTENHLELAAAGGGTICNG